MRQPKAKLAAALAVCATALSTPALATNGMLLEGYGPISQAMGGAFVAINTGTSGIANNPATLTMLEQGNHFDIGIDILKPDVAYTTGGRTYQSTANTFVLPSFGYVHRTGDWAFGAGVYAQGGLGSNYLSDYPAMPGPMYSQVSVLRVSVPVAYKVTDKLSVGATLDYVRSGWDLVFGPFDFRNGSNFSGSAPADGISGKIGMTYDITDRVTVGASYGFESGLGDHTGKGARVEGFQMAASANIGVAVKATNELLLTAEYQRNFWSDAINSITVTQNGIRKSFPQHWDDQDMFMFGAAYDVTPRFTVRAGVNFANNPVSKNVTAIFPATIENHYTAGFGYKLDEHNALNFSMAYAPEVDVKTEPSLMGSPGRVSHSQMSFQLMYSLKF